MVAEVRLERTSLAYETKLEPPPVYSAVKLHQKWSRQMESNHLPIGYRPIARPESFAGVEPGVRVELTYPVLQNRRIAAHAYPAHTHLEPEPGIEPCGCSATELHRLEPKRGFELRSGRYESPVLPIELLRLERVRRIKLRWLDWQSSAQPMSHTREKAFSGQLTALSFQRLPQTFWLIADRRSLTANSWLSKIWSGTPDLNRESLASRASGLSHFPSPRKTKKGVTTWWPPPFPEI